MLGTVIFFVIVGVALLIKITTEVAVKKERNIGQNDTVNPSNPAAAPAAIVQAHAENERPNKVNWLKVGGSILVGIIGALIALYLFLMVISQFKGCGDEDPEPTISTHEITYDVPQGGTPVYLHVGWKSFPTDTILIVTPGGQTIEDGPGIIIRPGYQPEGWYNVYPNPHPCRVKFLDTY